MADSAQNDKRNTHDECQAQPAWDNDAPAIEKRHDTERIDRNNVCNRIPDHVNNQRGKSDEHSRKNDRHAKAKLPYSLARLGHTLNAVGHTLTLIESIVIGIVYRTTIWIACGKPRQCARVNFWTLTEREWIISHFEAATGPKTGDYPLS